MTQIKKILFSKIDDSINIIDDKNFETRYVSRGNGEEVIIYLSSHTGCNRACRMCYLTQTGQTEMVQATLDDFVEQAQRSLATYIQSKKKTPESTEPKVLHFNWMARGEPLMNDAVMQDWANLSSALLRVAASIVPGVPVKFKISTIMSGLIEDEVQELPFKVNMPEIYYSLYSVNEEFRSRWLPKADDPRESLRLLSGYKQKGGLVRIHSSFISGHNDDLVDVRDMLRSIKFFGLVGKFNMIRFNSFDENRWVEPTYEELQAIREYIVSQGFDVQMVERVGEDVFASCGMFIPD